MELNVNEMIGEPDEQLRRKERQKRGLTFIIMAGAFVWGTYLIYTRPQIVFRLNEQVIVYNHADNPAVFNIATGIAAIAATFFLAAGARIWLVRSTEQSNTTKPRPRASWRRVWGTVNTAVLLLSIWSGYAALNPGKLRGTNPDLVLCIAAFVVVMLFAIAAPHFATDATFRRPQWGRFPLSWWRDPMQTLFMTTCFWAGWVVGSAAHLFTVTLSSDKTAMWTVLVYIAILAGLLIGQLMADALYRERIERNS
jgi:hypothetical protein